MYIYSNSASRKLLILLRKTIIPEPLQKNVKICSSQPNQTELCMNHTWNATLDLTQNMEEQVLEAI